jgi:hypothetical protein
MARVKPGRNWWATDPSPQARGYRFQFSLTKRIFEKLRGFKSVSYSDIQGNVITQRNHERVGPDGGTDLVIKIEAKNRAAGLQVAGKVKKVLKSLGDQ